MGYVSATRQTAPDFLVSVANALDRTMPTKEYHEIRNPEEGEAQTSNSCGVRRISQMFGDQPDQPSWYITLYKAGLWANRIWLLPLKQMQSRAWVAYASLSEFFFLQLGFPLLHSFLRAHIRHPCQCKCGMWYFAERHDR